MKTKKTTKAHKYFIKTFGCQANYADSERIAGFYNSRGFIETDKAALADEIVINTCSIRQSAEDRVQGLVKKIKSQKKSPKITITGCMVGMAAHDPSGKALKKLVDWLPEVDEFLPLEEVGFSYPAIRKDIKHAWVPISNGCNNFCTFCVVPFTRGREVSRPFETIIKEVEGLATSGYEHITLIGQNVNSYGSDLVKKSTFLLPDGSSIQPVMVSHLGRLRIPTLFPQLLTELTKIKEIKKISFLTSNPWDFSDELINVIAKNSKIDRYIHLPVQSGDDGVLKRMNRWYTHKEYLDLVKKIRASIPDVEIGTDIIVGFPGESKAAFENTVKLCKKVGFSVGFVSEYSDRSVTAAHKAFGDDISPEEKNLRFHILDKLTNPKIFNNAQDHS